MAIHRVGWVGNIGSPISMQANLPENCQLVAVCDIRPHALDRAREEMPELLVTDDFFELAKMNGCDTVASWTPNATHRDLAVACLQGGKHVFIEKPMGINLRQGRDILEAQEAAGKYVGVDLEYRWSAMGQQVKAILDSGEIGKIVQVELDHHRGGWLCDTPSGTYRTKKELSGLMKMEGIHYIDVFRYWFGEFTKLQVFAAPNALPHYEFPDNMTIMVWFENGALGRYTTSHNKAAASIGPDVEKAGEAGHILRFGIVGEKGVLLIDGWKTHVNIMKFDAKPSKTNSLKPELERRIDYSVLAHPMSSFHDIVGCRREFIRRMSLGLPPYQPAADAYRSETIAMTVDRSASLQGGVIDVPALFA